MRGLITARTTGLALGEPNVALLALLELVVYFGNTCTVFIDPRCVKFTRFLFCVMDNFDVRKKAGKFLYDRYGCAPSGVKLNFIPVEAYIVRVPFRPPVSNVPIVPVTAGMIALVFHRKLPALFLTSKSSGRR